MTAGRGVRLVAMREIREGLRNRAFVLTFLFSLVLIVGSVVVPSLLTGDDTLPLGVVGDVALTDELVAAGSSAGLDVEVTTYDDLAAAEQAVRDGDVDAVVVDGRELLVERSAAGDVQALVADVVGQRVLADRLDDLGLAAADAQSLFAAAQVPVRSLEEPDEVDGAAVVFAFGGTILLLLGVTFFASSVLTGVVEEKSSRVVEVVLGAVRPTQLLAGKLLGIGSLAAGQVTVLVAAAYLAVVVTGVVDVPATTLPTALAVIGWFVLGFAFYSVVYAAAGALVNRTEDAQSSAGPIGFVLFGAYAATFMVVLPDPDGRASTILSQVPGFSALTMPARVALGAVSTLEMMTAVLLSVVATGVAVRLAGRIYERSLLRTEQVRWREALRREPSAG